MNIEYLREFLDLANTLNFTKTSSNLHMAQPTLSRHIADLEKQIGSPLFIRTTNSVKLTQAGRMLYEKASALVSDYSDIIESVHKATAQEITTLYVSGSTVQPTVTRLFSKLATRAALEHAPIRFEYKKSRSLSNESPSPYALDALKSGEIDLAIDTCPMHAIAPRGFESMLLCNEPLIIVASSDNPLAHASRLRIEDLFANTLVAFAVQQHCPQVLFEPFLRAGYSSHRTKTVFVDNLMEIPEQLASLKPDEIVPMQQYYCESFGFDQDGVNKLCALDMDDARANGSFWAIWRKGDDNDALNQAIDLLKTIVGEYKSSAAPNQWCDDKTLWSSAFYAAH